MPSLRYRFNKISFREQLIQILEAKIYWRLVDRLYIKFFESNPPQVEENLLTHLSEKYHE